MVVVSLKVVTSSKAVHSSVSVEWELFVKVSLYPIVCPGGVGGSQDTMIFIGPSCSNLRLTGADATALQRFKMYTGMNICEK